MTSESVHNLVIANAVTWGLLFFNKMIQFIPELQVIALFLAIFSTFITILLNIPKLIKFFKNLLV